MCKNRCSMLHLDSSSFYSAIFFLNSLDLNHCRTAQQHFVYFGNFPPTMPPITFKDSHGF